MEQAGIPVIGSLSNNTQNLTSADFFPIGANSLAVAYGQLALAKTKGTKMAIAYCAEIAACAQVVPFAKLVAQSAGVDIVYSGAISSSAPDYTAQCQAIKNSGAESFEAAAAGPAALRFAAACHAQGVTATLLLANEPQVQTAATPGAEGALIVDSLYPFFDTSIPAAQKFRDTIDKYSPGLSGVSTYSGEENDRFDSASLFAKAVLAAGPGDVTPASVKKGLYALKAETLGGLIPPVTYTPGKPTAVNCYFTYTVTNAKFALLPVGTKTQCAPDDLIESLRTTLKLVGS
jgi:branched-chain amino acid transport system substrate-binding protein